MSKKPLTLPAVLPGPMDGVTAGSWLEVLTRRQWVSMWWSPFLRISTAVPHLPRLRKFIQPYEQTGLPYIVQIMGVDSQLLAQAAAGFQALGVRMVDLNCACPSQTVVGNGAGGSRLKHPRWIGETIDAIRKAAPGLKVSVKVRCGFHSPQEFTQEIAPVLRDTAPDLVTVHFRTVEEGYREVLCRQQRLEDVRRALPELTLYAAGDIWSAEDALEVIRQHGMDGVAPARGMLKNPRLCAECLAALQGRALPPMDDQLRWEVLQELTQNAPLGFALQMTANLFGRDSKEFQQQLQQRLHRRI